MYKTILLKLQDLISNLLYKYELKHPIHMTIKYCYEDDVYINEQGQRINISGLKVGDTFKFNKKKYITTDCFTISDSTGIHKEALSYQLNEYNRKFKVKKPIRLY